MSPLRSRQTAEGGKRAGRIWILLILVAASGILLISFIGISSQEPGANYQDVVGVGDSQGIFGGVRQLDDRLGRDDAPVQIQYFVDVQVSTYQDQFLETIPPLVTRQVRDGDVKLLLRNRSLARNATQLSFYGIQAAAEQSYGWQYAYLMIRNQEEAAQRGLDDEFLTTLAESIENLDPLIWKEDFDEGRDPGSDMTRDLAEQDKLAIQLEIREAPAFVVTGPNGTEILQDAPDLDALELAIAAVR